MKNKMFKLIALISFLLIAACSEKQEKIELSATYTNGFEHPTQVLIRGDNFIVAEMMKPLLYLVENLENVTEGKVLIGADSGIALKSPHFMIEHDGSIYITEGRGDNVFAFALNGNQASAAVLEEGRLNRPHGICIDKDKWIYIADSVNSRLIRIHSKTKELQVFADKQKRVAYGRQLLCRDDGVWVSNSYEKSFKLNPGTGSNVLKISDFQSGESEIIVEYRDTNTTGITVLDNRYLVVGRWSGKFDVVIYDLKLKKELRKLHTYDEALDAPYGITLDEANRKFYIAFLGLGKDRSHGKTGGFKVFNY